MIKRDSFQILSEKVIYWFSTTNMQLKYIFRYKTGAMRRMQNLVSKGYFYHTSGTIPLESSEQLHLKFARKYDTELDDVKRCRAYKKGEGVCKAQSIMFYCESDEVVRYWLLRSDGTSGRILEEETMHDTRDCLLYTSPSPRDRG